MQRTIFLDEPADFRRLTWTYTEPDALGRFQAVAPCGCMKHLRLVLNGPLAGRCYGDVRYEVVCGGCHYPRKDEAAPSP